MEKTLRLLTISIIVLFAFISFMGCEGDDGAQGLPGAPGAPGEDLTRTVSESCVLCHEQFKIADIAEAHTLPGTYLTAINDVVVVNTVDSTSMTVDFTITDEDGVGVEGISGTSSPLSTSSIRFAVAQLVPGALGNATAWQSYINTTETKGAGDPGSAPDGTTIQATYERANAAGGVFMEAGGGNYTYTFSFNFEEVTSPVPVAYDPALTHRVAMQVSENETNAFLDFVPDGSPVSLTREVVVNGSCNECHGKLEFHGGDRIAVEYCVTCHNPGSTDANSGNTVDIKVMVHKIHMGEHLPSVQAGGEYAIWGHDDTKIDFSEVVYPQDIRNCTKCHKNGLDSGNWQTVPTREACGSCHDNVNFNTGANHIGGPQLTNNLCAFCHTASGVVEAHKVLTAEKSAEFAYRIISITNTAPGQFPEVTFEVQNPGDSNYDILQDPEWTTPGGVSRLAVLIGWDTTDYGNAGSGRTPAQPLSIDALADAVDNNDGTFTVTSSTAIPADATGTGVAAIEGHPAYINDLGQPEDLDGDGELDRVAVKNAFMYFPITDVNIQERRQVVDVDKCKGCHGVLSLHGNNRTDEPLVCVICHNGDATDVSRRPANPANTSDGKTEESIDFKRMIHSIHAAGIRQGGLYIWGFGNVEHDFSDVKLPNTLRNLVNCEGCHLEGTYELPLDDAVKATTVSTGRNKSDASDDFNITAVSSVCSSCHDNSLSTNHMEQNGGGFDVRESEIE